MDTLFDGVGAQTYFGRHYETLSLLEVLLQERKRPEGVAYRALVIGAGLAPHKTFSILGASLPADYRGEASALYSFEPFEVAALLHRLGTGYEVVVYDKRPDVLESVMAQRQMPVDDFFGSINKNLMGYIRQLAGTVPSSPDKGLLEAINSAAAAGNLANRLTMLYFLDISELLERMSFCCGNIRDGLLDVPGCFDLVTAFNSGIREVPSYLANRINRGGIVCVGNNYLDMRMLRAPEGFNKMPVLDMPPTDEFSSFYGEAILQRAA
ncbi:hypothetical protein HYV82_04485 [Candidatus Woesearchaeota archaeon]|nr:hypothetical protein [Candidatus Woesearchaeota archaeon]